MNALSSPADEPETPKRAPKRRLLVQGLVGAAVGAVFGAAAARLAFGGELDVRWADLLAALSALICAGSGLVLLAGSLSAERLGRMLRYDGPASVAEMRAHRWAALVMLLAAVLLVLPPAAAVLGWPAAGAFAAVLAVFAVQTGANVAALRGHDELMRRVALEAGSLTFWIAQALLFVYAAAERIGLAPAVNAWDVLSVLFLLYLVVAGFVAVRRGAG